MGDLMHALPALTEAKEFEGIYNLEVVEIPPNIKMNRDDKND